MEGTEEEDGDEDEGVQEEEGNTRGQVDVS